MSGMFATCPNCGIEYAPMRKLPDGTMEQVPFAVAFRCSTTFNEPSVVDEMICPNCSRNMREDHWFKTAERIKNATRFRT